MRCRGVWASRLECISSLIELASRTNKDVDSSLCSFTRNHPGRVRPQLASFFLSFLAYSSLGLLGLAGQFQVHSRMLKKSALPTFSHTTTHSEGVHQAAQAKEAARRTHNHRL